MRFTKKLRWNSNFTSKFYFKKRFERNSFAKWWMLEVYFDLGPVQTWFVLDSGTISGKATDPRTNPVKLYC